LDNPSTLSTAKRLISIAKPRINILAAELSRAVGSDDAAATDECSCNGSPLMEFVASNGENMLISPLALLREPSLRPRRRSPGFEPPRGMANGYVSPRMD
jgi:hypothetical protein